MSTGIERVQELAGAIEHVLVDELKLQPPMKFQVVKDGKFILMLAVMDARNLRGALHKYANEHVVHQLSTAVGGLPVVLSNHSGLRYAVSLTGKPRLPKAVNFPDALTLTPNPSPDGRGEIIPFGVSLRGAVHLEARKIVNLIVAGSQDSGKSTLLRLLAHVNRAHGAKLYLADPQSHTFNPDVWNRFTAAPVAGKRAEVLELIGAMQAEIENRSALFRVAAVGGIPPNDVDEYNELPGVERLPRVWFIGDEMNAFMGERVVQERMAELARGGRKWGVHVVLAAHTWRKEDIPSSVSAMFPSRLCLRVADNTSGPVTLSDSQRGKEPMKFRTAGRAILFAVGKFQKVQLYYVSPEQEREWLGEALSDQSSVISPLAEDEMTMVMKAISEQNGKMTGDFLMGCGLSDTGARKLTERYEARGWLAKDPRQGNAKVVTEKLRVLVQPPSASPPSPKSGRPPILGEEGTNQQSQQTSPSLYMREQGSPKGQRSLDMGVV